MLIRPSRPWDLPESKVTPEDVFYQRRRFLAAGTGAAAAVAMAAPLTAHAEDAANPTADLYPATLNPAFGRDQLIRPLTEEAVNESYNNFYEFGSHKNIAEAAQALPVHPWTVQLDGLVETPRSVDFDTLVRAMPLEERYYRHRCVEAWSMTAPWSGFPFKALIDYARPLSGARYVRMETFLDPEIAIGQRASWYPWPYVEGITMAEAMNDLAFLVTGAYGKPLAKQFGAPLRLALPWKYGFKSIKSITRFSFVTERPVSFWEEIQPREYGFWANVNPKVPHSRWSQATERILGTNERVPTLLFNGYSESVADLYKNLTDEALYV